MERTETRRAAAVLIALVTIVAAGVLPSQSLPVALTLGGVCAFWLWFDN